MRSLLLRFSAFVLLFATTACETVTITDLPPEADGDVGAGTGEPPLGPRCVDNAVLVPSHPPEACPSFMKCESDVRLRCAPPAPTYECTVAPLVVDHDFEVSRSTTIFIEDVNGDGTSDIALELTTPSSEARSSTTVVLVSDESGGYRVMRVRDARVRGAGLGMFVLHEAGTIAIVRSSTAGGEVMVERYATTIEFAATSQVEVLGDADGDGIPELFEHVEPQLWEHSAPERFYLSRDGVRYRVDDGLLAEPVLGVADVDGDGVREVLSQRDGGWVTSKLTADKRAVELHTWSFPDGDRRPNLTDRCNGQLRAADFSGAGRDEWLGPFFGYENDCLYETPPASARFLGPYGAQLPKSIDVPWASPSHWLKPVWLGDIDGDGKADAVVDLDLPYGEDVSMHDYAPGHVLGFFPAAAMSSDGLRTATSPAGDFEVDIEGIVEHAAGGKAGALLLRTDSGLKLATGCFGEGGAS